MKIKIAILSLLFSGAATAKCIEQHYSVSGVVRGTSGEPLSGALVAAEWRYFVHISSVSSISDGVGEFELNLDFDPLSGEGFEGDQCNGHLEVITVRASKEGFIEGFQKISPVHKTNRLYLRLSK